MRRLGTIAALALLVAWNVAFAQQAPAPYQMHWYYVMDFKNPNGRVVSKGFMTKEDCNAARENDARTYARVESREHSITICHPMGGGQ